jgi:ribosomal protein RSM22 (predicted rRNA methylase)
MELPTTLQQALEEELTRIPVAALRRAVSELSQQYKEITPEKRAGYQSTSHRLAYLATRLPATYAANLRALSELSNFIDQNTNDQELSLKACQIASILDLGAGPGTAALAASTIFPEAEDVTLLERDPEMAQIGMRLQRAVTSSSWSWRTGNLLTINDQNATQSEPSSNSTKADLVIASYCLGELPKQSLPSVINHALLCSKKFALFIEPGTPEGFATISALRDQILARGAWSIIAPCTHSHGCPLRKIPSPEDPLKWCHFPVRLNRTHLHQLTKQGTLSYEDEKFSYLIVGRKDLISAKPPGLTGDLMASETTPARIIGHPRHQKGLVRLELCTKNGVASTFTISKREKSFYRESKRKSWGEKLLGIAQRTEAPDDE